MESKANAIAYKNRGLASQTLTKIAPVTGKRAVHEIRVEDIQKVAPKDKSGGGSRRLTRQNSRAINDQYSKDSIGKKVQGTKKNVKFSANDSILHNTADDRSEFAADPMGLVQENSLIQQTMATDSKSSKLKKLQKSPQNYNQYDALKDFSGYPQLSTLRPMDGNY